MRRALMMSKPKFIVFDLDCTMWPWHLDMSDPPFRKARDGKIVDRLGHKVKGFPDVPQILKTLKSDGYIIGAASRTTELEAGHQLLDLLGWDEYISFREIYPGQKMTHFKALQKSTGIAFKDMLFFDDEYRNIRDVSKLGVTCFYCQDGMSNEVLKKGFALFSKNNS
ncbi:hypothetical protein CAPTEDRAFT_148534 [Capitella teleta]|uniref:Magnesium-dependent phosphatase-1 n=1 Tax=Capitella teleta TaxID=283909 RepID=R7U4R3_CAPTE|nr:hypothetical protein CAPTEDRAFT_148534 [Capitella teleta]|eukprot:ELT98686.1 hypothetical protein CAPTEDRAFT_148534 [Capitella teleta]